MVELLDVVFYRTVGVFLSIKLNGRKTIKLFSPTGRSGSDCCRNAFRPSVLCSLSIDVLKIGVFIGTVERKVGIVLDAP
ncbi:hypothetical protein D3C85_1625110 [compost metagenome]